VPELVFGAKSPGAFAPGFDDGGECLGGGLSGEGGHASFGQVVEISAGVGDPEPRDHALGLEGAADGVGPESPVDIRGRERVGQSLAHQA
jgi:hypothetical protein